MPWGRDEMNIPVDEFQKSDPNRVPWCSYCPSPFTVVTLLNYSPGHPTQFYDDQRACSVKNMGRGI